MHVSRVRCGAHWIVNLKYFDIFIMIIIGLSSIALAAEDPVDEHSKINHFLDKLDHAFTAVFAVEMFLKIIDLGLIFHPGSYLRGKSIGRLKCYPLIYTILLIFFRHLEYHGFGGGCLCSS